MSCSSDRKDGAVAAIEDLTAVMASRSVDRSISRDISGCRRCMFCEESINVYYLELSPDRKCRRKNNTLV